MDDRLNNNEVDGFDNNERAEGNIGLRPSMDGVQEVDVDTSSYSAENGHAAGAIVNVITKSGSNQFHGSAFEYFRNDIFDAWEYFAKQGASFIHKPEMRWNQFGGSFGGPIKKDKTFFFGDVEEDRMIQGVTYQIQVPTLYEEQHPGDFTDVPGPFVTKFTPTDQIALNYGP